MRATITILGSGTSTGVPVIGCDCTVCRSLDPRDKRTRASLMIEAGAERIVVDTGPDFRQQMLREGVRELRHVLYTHTHADHCHGFDDLRAFYFRQKLPVECYIAERFASDFRTRFAYAFEDTGYSGTKPQVVLKTFAEAPFRLAGLTIEPVSLPHGHFLTSAFRIGRFAYATDFKTLPGEVLDRWRGQLELMVASGVHFGTHKTHATVPETLEIFRNLQVKSGVVTHLGHEVDAKTRAADLPAHVQFAEDGLKIEVDL